MNIIRDVQTGEVKYIVVNHQVIDASTGQVVYSFEDSSTEPNSFDSSSSWIPQHSLTPQYGQDAPHARGTFREDNVNRPKPGEHVEVHDLQGNKIGWGPVTKVTPTHIFVNHKPHPNHRKFVRVESHINKAINALLSGLSVDATLKLVENGAILYNYFYGSLHNPHLPISWYYDKEGIDDSGVGRTSRRLLNEEFPAFSGWIDTQGSFIETPPQQREDAARKIVPAGPKESATVKALNNGAIWVNQQGNVIHAHIVNSGQPTEQERLRSVLDEYHGRMEADVVKVHYYNQDDKKGLVPMGHTLEYDAHDFIRSGFDAKHGEQRFRGE